MPHPANRPTGRTRFIPSMENPADSKERILGCKKSEQEGKSLAWLSQGLPVKLKGKRELHKQWQQGQVPWEEHRDTPQLCRDEVREAKAWLELSLAKDAKNNNKGFYRYVRWKRRSKKV